MFQSTPLREGRPSKQTELDGLGEFQSTPLREGRHYENQLKAVSKEVSIHAPPRGATSRKSYSRGSQSFNPRPSARGDPKDYREKMNTIVFQSTPLREGRRHKMNHLKPLPKSFNPRPSARGDMTYEELTSNIGVVSIHAPPRGATKAERLGVV